MSNKKNHNTIYFLTTLSVYLGILVVGASPQVFAQATFAETSPSQSFELRTNADSVFSKFKLKKRFEYKDVLPFAFLGNSSFNNRHWEKQKAFQAKSNLYPEIISVNDQVFTVSILPRASI